MHYASTQLKDECVGAQSDAISTTVGKGRHRVHCSLNINTETGRLSARRPNLQNQPALEKDRYKVRPCLAAPLLIAAVFAGVTWRKVTFLMCAC